MGHIEGKIGRLEDWGSVRNSGRRRRKPGQRRTERAV